MSNCIYLLCSSVQQLIMKAALQWKMRSIESIIDV